MRWTQPPINSNIQFMGVVFLRVLVGLLTLSFAASGLAVGQCATVSRLAAGMTQQSQPSPQTHTSSHHAHAQHDHGATDHRHAADDTAPGTPDVHPSNACCSACLLVGAMMPEVELASVLAVSTASFSFKADCCSAASVSIDPGIPKRIV